MACKKKAPGDVSTAPAQLHPDLYCPEGTHGEGFPPPDGVLVYCVLDGNAGLTIKQGPSIEWFSSGQKQASGNYTSNQRVGEWVFWYESGIIEKQGRYLNNVQDGRWVEFHASGLQSAEGVRVNGRESGLWVYWSNGDNTRTEGNWANGQQDGDWTDYASDGTPLRQRIFRMGRLINQREL
jgi:antitoxin component YwqK of YwqJK toxin-antitoxin module